MMMNHYLDSKQYRRNKLLFDEIDPMLLSKDKKKMTRNQPLTHIRNNNRDSRSVTNNYNTVLSQSTANNLDGTRSLNPIHQISVGMRDNHEKMNKNLMKINKDGQGRMKRSILLNQEANSNKKSSLKVGQSSSIHENMNIVSIQNPPDHI